MKIRFSEIYDTLSTAVLYIRISNVPFFRNYPIKYLSSAGNFMNLQWYNLLYYPQCRPQTVTRNTPANGVELGDQPMHVLARGVRFSGCVHFFTLQWWVSDGRFQPSLPERHLTRREGVLPAGSSGTASHLALAPRPDTTDRRPVVGTLSTRACPPMQRVVRERGRVRSARVRYACSVLEPIVIAVWLLGFDSIPRESTFGC